MWAAFSIAASESRARGIDLQGLVRAIEKLDRGEPKITLTYILEIMDLVFALPIDELTGFARRIDGLDDRPIFRVRFRPTCVTAVQK